RAKDESEANSPPKVLRKDHAAFRPAHSTLKGESLAPIGLDAGFTISTPTTQDAPTAVTRRYLSAGVGRVKNLLPGYTGRVSRHGGSHSTAEVAMGSQLRLRFEQEVRLLKKAKAKIARRDQRIQAREEEVKRLDQEIKALRVVEVEVHDLRNQTKNLETLLEAEVDMKKVAEDKNAELAKELESLHAFADVVSTGLVKSISEGLKHGIDHGRAGRDLAAIEPYDLEADKSDTEEVSPSRSVTFALAPPNSRSPYTPRRRSARWFVVPIGLVLLITLDLTASCIRAYRRSSGAGDSVG
nr:hypothetical protein [Tanacetum cinerariifolium]